MATVEFLLTQRDGRIYVVPLCRRCQQRIIVWSSDGEVVTSCGCGTERRTA